MGTGGTQLRDELEPGEPGGTTAPGSPDRAPRRVDLGGIALSVLGVVGVLAVWQAAVALDLVSELTMPPPSEVLPTIPDLIADPEFRTHLYDTLLTWALAVAMVTVVAVPVGLAIGSIRVLQRPATGLIHVLRSIPTTALIPIAILFFRLGIQMKLAVVVYAITWPLLLNAMYGAQAVDPAMRTVGRALRLNRRRTFFQIVLPAAARYIGTGVRLAGGIAFVVVLGAELLGASKGIGTLLVRFQQAEMPDMVFAGIVVVGIIGVLMYQVLATVERRMSPWAPEHRRA